jgi:hypothetical protein
MPIPTEPIGRNLRTPAREAPGGETAALDPSLAIMRAMLEADDGR